MSFSILDMDATTSVEEIVEAVEEFSILDNVEYASEYEQLHQMQLELANEEANLKLASAISDKLEAAVSAENMVEQESLAQLLYGPDFKLGTEAIDMEAVKKAIGAIIEKIKEMLEAIISKAKKLFNVSEKMADAVVKEAKKEPKFQPIDVTDKLVKSFGTLFPTLAQYNNLSNDYKLSGDFNLPDQSDVFTKIGKGYLAIAKDISEGKITKADQINDAVMKLVDKPDMELEVGLKNGKVIIAKVEVINVTVNGIGKAALISALAGAISITSSERGYKSFKIPKQITSSGLDNLIDYLESVKKDSAKAKKRITDLHKSYITDIYDPLKELGYGELVTALSKQWAILTPSRVILDYGTALQNATVVVSNAQRFVHANTKKKEEK